MYKTPLVFNLINKKYENIDKIIGYTFIISDDINRYSQTMK